MFDTVITDTFALQRHYIFREGYIFTAMTEPANVYDAIVIRHPSDCDCWTPKLGHSSRTLDEHIRFINEHHITKAIIIAESIDFIRQCPSLHELMIIPADSAPVPFSYIPLYHSDIHYLDCRTSYVSFGSSLRIFISTFCIKIAASFHALATELLLIH